MDQEQIDVYAEFMNYQTHKTDKDVRLLGLLVRTWLRHVATKGLCLDAVDKEAYRNFIARKQILQEANLHVYSKSTLRNLALDYWAVPTHALYH